MEFEIVALVFFFFFIFYFLRALHKQPVWFLRCPIWRWSHHRRGFLMLLRFGSGPLQRVLMHAQTTVRARWKSASIRNYGYMGPSKRHPSVPNFTSCWLLFNMQVNRFLFSWISWFIFCSIRWEAPCPFVMRLGQTTIPRDPWFPTLWIYADGTHPSVGVHGKDLLKDYIISL